MFLLFMSDGLENAQTEPVVNHSMKRFDNFPMKGFD
ncbi:hypothetical protein SAMN05216605_10614 [Pseudomonas abietaniphila]|jgi:hypothetical protein|uniref:Uncharacterized protein n=1 Tax=Pseudomonas abietaniphila TaxID=89065 RepID=A0A1G8BLI5_9PSED|nr:hypothetical protein SAMN05216605_10614 [Pseudomonas abietaniphila]